MPTNNAKSAHRLLMDRAFKHVITLPQQRIHCEHSWTLTTETQIHDIETKAVCEGRIQPIEFCKLMIDDTRAWTLSLESSGPRTHDHDSPERSVNWSYLARLFRMRGIATVVHTALNGWAMEVKHEDEAVVRHGSALVVDIRNRVGLILDQLRSITEEPVAVHEVLRIAEQVQALLPHPKIHDLSDIELELYLQLTGGQRCTLALAQALGVFPGEVESHIRSINKKNRPVCLLRLRGRSLEDEAPLVITDR